MRFVFDTNVLIDYIHKRPLADDALFAAAGKGEVFISIVSLMELTVFDEEEKTNRKSNRRIQEELDEINLRDPYRPMSLGRDRRIQEELDEINLLCQRLRIKQLPISTRAQEHALTLLREPSCRSLLGKNVLTDSLIIGTGLVKKACLVTREGNWFELARRLPRLGQVLSPEQVVREFG